MPGIHAGSRTPPKIEHLYSIKVDNLSYNTTMSDVERYFKKYGELGDIYIPRDRDTHESRGFAFVRFYEERDAEDAMDSMDGKVIDGREIRVALARYGRPSNQYDPRRGSRGYDRRGSSNYGYRDRERRDDRRRRSPDRRRRSRSRSRSKDRRSRSRSRSPRGHRRSASRSPRRSLSPRKRSPSPARRSLSPRRRSSSPRRSRSKSRSRSRSRHD